MEAVVKLLSLLTSQTAMLATSSSSTRWPRGTREGV